MSTIDVEKILRFLDSTRATGTLALSDGEIDVAEGRAVAAWHAGTIGRIALDALKASEPVTFSFTARAARPTNIEAQPQPQGVRASLSMLVGRTVPRLDLVTREQLIRRAAFGMKAPSLLDEPAAAANVWMPVALAALVNALIAEYAGETYGGVIWNDDVAARLAAAGPPLGAPLSLVQGRIDLGAVRDRTDLNEVVPFLRSLLRAVHGEAVRTTGDGAARRGYRAAVTKQWSGQERVVSAALQIVEERAPADALLVVTKTLSGSFRLVDREYTIGRASAADIFLPHPSVSRRHARIVPRGGAHVLSDLGSTSGTLVNGAKIGAERALRQGDLIGLGDVELRYERA